MFTAGDIYEAFLAGQEWWRNELKRMGLDTPKPYAWHKLPELERRKYEIMAERLNAQQAAEKEESASEEKA